MLTVMGLRKIPSKYCAAAFIAAKKALGAPLVEESKVRLMFMCGNDVWFWRGRTGTESTARSDHYFTVETCQRGVLAIPPRRARDAMILRGQMLTEGTAKGVDWLLPARLNLGYGGVSGCPVGPGRPSSPQP